MDLKVLKLHPEAILPSRGTESAAGLDLYARIDEPVDLQNGVPTVIGTGIAVELPDGVFGSIRERSSLGAKLGIRVGGGVVDSDYRGEVKVSLTLINRDIPSHRIQPGDRIAQLIIQPYLRVQPVEIAQISGTVRGEAGFGSTGR